MTVDDYNGMVKDLYATYRGSNDSYAVAREVAGMVSGEEKGYLNFCGFGGSGYSSIRIYTCDAVEHKTKYHVVACVDRLVFDPIHGFSAVGLDEYIAMLLVSQGIEEPVVIDTDLPLTDICRLWVEEALDGCKNVQDIWRRWVGFDVFPYRVVSNNDKMERVMKYMHMFRTEEEVNKYLNQEGAYLV